MGLAMIEKNAIKELATLIDDAINTKGMTSKQVSEAIGVSMETVRRWRKGENLPSRVGIEAMAKTILEDRMADLRAAVDAGFEVVEDPYIFASDPTGAAPWHPDWPTHAFAFICKSLSLDFHLHQLRHFTATQLIAAGVDIRTVSGRLGHSDPTVTLRVYSHVVESADLRATEIMSGLLNTNNSANSLKST